MAEKYLSPKRATVALVRSLDHGAQMRAMPAIVSLVYAFFGSEAVCLLESKIFTHSNGETLFLPPYSANHFFAEVAVMKRKKTDPLYGRYVPATR